MLHLCAIIKFLRAFIILGREGVFLEFNSDVLPLISPLISAANLFARNEKIDRGSALLVALPKIGPFYVKLGQFLASRPDIIGGNLASKLALLQDSVEPFDQESAERIIRDAFNKDVHDIFVTFGGPVAAASVAQVHRAEVLCGGQIRDVAVKILRPGIKNKFERNLSELRTIAIIAEKFSSEARRLKLVEVIATLTRTIAFETDLRMEAAAICEFADKITNPESIRVPFVDWQRTSRDILTIEWIDGIPLSDPKAISAAGFDCTEIARVILQCFLRQALLKGIFHADMHQGNLFVDRAGQLVLIDFGIVGRLGVKERAFLAESLYSLISQDYSRAAELHFEHGYVNKIYSVDEFAQGLRAAFEKMSSDNASDISMASILSHLFETQSLFDMQTRVPLVLFERTMVVAEGVARACDPSLNLWQTYEPVVDEWMNYSLGFRYKLVSSKNIVINLSELAIKMPGILSKAEAALNDFSLKGFELSQNTLEKIDCERRNADYRLFIGLAIVVAFIVLF